MTNAPTGLRIDWDATDRAAWDRLAARAPFCPFEQSWLYGDAYARDDAHTVGRAVVFDGDAPVAIAQVFRRRVAGIAALAQILRGPVLLDPALAPDAVDSIFHLIRSDCRRRRQILFWTPELRAEARAFDLMRRCGLRQVLTGYGSAQIDLAPDAPTLRSALHGKWRNALTQAEGSALRIETAADSDAVPWLLDRYGALRRRRRFGGPGPAMLVAVLDGAASRDIALLRAYAAGDPVAGALFLRHGQGASYLVGWTGAAGRKKRAGTLLLWRGLLEMRARGARLLDLGGIDTRHAPGIARFKLGVGGEPYRLAGTFA